MIRACIHYYECELLFLHRDAESAPWKHRRQEIDKALAGLDGLPPIVAVIPVRMQEAWLLTNLSAIRQAADNPNGDEDLAVPPLHALESLPDPKAVLHDLLKKASGLKGRRLKSFYSSRAAVRVSQWTEDFSLLRQIPAFQRLEREFSAVLQQARWNKKPAGQRRS